MKRLILFIIIYLPFIGYTQPIQFTKDSIPIVEGKVVFNVKFEFDLSKEEFRERAHSYFNDVLNPYSGVFYLDNDEYTVCKIVDYLNIKSSLLQTFAMYMTYGLQLEYKDGLCTMVIQNITYMEKQYFEANEASERKLNMPEYTGEDIMIDDKYSFIFQKKASERITDVSIKRINEIIKNLNVSFTRK